MTGEEALLRLAGSTAEAVGAVLETFAPGAIERGTAVIVPSGESPFQTIPVPAVATSVSYTGGVIGGNVFVIGRLGARRLASLMMHSDSEEIDDRELSELELSAIDEAMNQMMAAAARATSAILGETVEIGPPQTRFFELPQEAAEAYDATPWATSVSFTIAGEPGRLIQLVPNAFVVRMTRALDELGNEVSADESGQATCAAKLPPESVRRLPVRVSAELGRTRMPLGRAVALAGAVVELDRGVDEPIAILVNGRPFATGRLLVADGEWAVRIEGIRPGLRIEDISSGRKKISSPRKE